MVRPPRPEPVLQPPALLRRWQTWAALMAILLIPFFLPIATELRRNPLLGPMGDRLHIPLFTAVALMLYWKGPLRGRLWRSAAAAAAIGLAVEYLQGFVGRAPRWVDFLFDVQGIGLALGWVWWRGYRRRGGLLLGLGLIALALAQLHFVPGLIAASNAARERFPLLDDFEGRYAGDLWDWNNGGVTEVVPGGPGGGGHVLRISSGPSRRWPGANMHHFPHDWTGYRELLLDARRVAGPGDLTAFHVRLDDFQSRHDRSWLTVELVASREWETFVVPLDGRTDQGAGRRLDLADIDYVVVFTNGAPDSVIMEIDNVRLR